MISRTGKGNFFAAHYDWMAAVLGLLALAGAGAYCMFGGNVDDEIAAVMSRMDAKKVTKATVAEQDVSAYAVYTDTAKAKKCEALVCGDKSDVLFASAKRLMCCNTECGRVTPEKYDADKNLVCAVCGFTQEVAKVEVVKDSDNDGLPDAWEIRHGFDPKNPDASADADGDADGDGFSNLEEFQANTDPKDKKSHPDYLDSLMVAGPLEETRMPFVLLAANKIPKGWRCEFFDAKQRDDYGRLGRSITAVVGEEIGKSGFILRAYEKKSTKRAIKGSVNKREVDVSEATVERKSDGKKITLVVAENKKAKPAAVDVQAKLKYSRGAVEKTFNVVTGTEIELNGVKYKIIEVSPAGKGSVVIGDPYGKKRTLPCP